jgi:TolB-like protein/Flp pilus assembly protein TadD
MLQRVLSAAAKAPFMQDHSEIQLRLAGPLRLIRCDGTDITPRSVKAQALLALLGAAPGARRSRAWLQDKLWSDRGPEQAAASLRQVLAELRRSFGDCRDCLVTDAGWVGLDLRRVKVQIDPEPADFGLAGEPPEFAEGLDVHDPEFEDWIRDQRLAYAGRMAPRATPERELPTAQANADVATTERGVAAFSPMARPRKLGRGAVAGILLLFLAALAAAWLWSGLRLPDVPVAGYSAAQSAMPSIAVQKFHSFGGGPDQEALVLGVTRDIITDLSKFVGLFVIAADTSFRFVDLYQPGARAANGAIPVRYVLSGSVQRLGDQDQFRVNVQLIETEMGRLVWADRVDRPADDLLKLQNEIVRRVVDVIGPVSAGQGWLRQAELDRLARIPTENLQAYHHYLKGVMQSESGTPAGNLQARASFERATELDPDYSRAYAMATWTYLNEVWDGRTDTPDALLAEAEALASRALEADPREAYAHWALGAVRLFQRRHDESIAAYRRAVELNPNGQDLLMYFGWALAYAGKPDEGIAFMQQAIDRNPYHPGWYLWDVAWGHFVARRYQDAAEALERRNPKTPGTHELLALCYAMLGRDADAAREMTIVLRAKPYFTIKRAALLEPFAREEDLQHYIRALRAAGVPEGAGG